MCTFIAICDQGCFNNGTCELPNVCKCAEGWSGELCTDGMYV